MANMSYCRFVNTFQDLLDCQENISESVSKSEHKYRLKLIKLCRQIAEEFEDYSEEELKKLPVDED